MKTIAIPSQDHMIHCNIIEGDNTSHVIIFTGGVGIRQDFYAPFLAFLAEKTRYTCLSLDYQGIGKSKLQPLKKYNCTLYDWKYDIEALLEYAEKTYSESKIIYLTHSFGGQIFGVLNNSAFHKVIFIASQNGYWGNYQKNGPYWFIWKLLIPLITKFKGYFPAKRFGMGEDMPRNVILQWRKWCLNPNYLMGDNTMDLARYEQVNAEIQAFAIADDQWGDPSAVQSVLDFYPNAQTHLEIIEPQEYNLERIGHSGLFRKQEIWPRIAEEIQG